MSRRWRPSLPFVLGGALAGTLGLSLAGLVALRYLGPVIGFQYAAILLALAITAATACLGWLLARLLLRPIRALETYARALESAEAAAPPRHFGTRELHATGRRVIAMAETLRDREATIRGYTDHVTHELKTPVSSIRAAVELLADSPSLTPEDRGLVDGIDGAREQIETQLDALRRAARARETRYLGRSTLAEVLPSLRAAQPGLSVRVTNEDCSLPLSTEGLTIVLGHLLGNASESGAREVRLDVTAGNRRVELDISDDGPGISRGNVDRIFDPFFTTRRETGGTGMGLTLVRNILRAHRAEIDLVAAAPGTGARFRLGFEDAAA